MAATYNQYSPLQQQNIQHANFGVISIMNQEQKSPLPNIISCAAGYGNNKEQLMRTNQRSVGPQILAVSTNKPPPPCYHMSVSPLKIDEMTPYQPPHHIYSRTETTTPLAFHLRQIGQPPHQFQKTLAQSIIAEEAAFPKNQTNSSSLLNNGLMMQAAMNNSNIHHPHLSSTTMFATPLAHKQPQIDANMSGGLKRNNSKISNAGSLVKKGGGSKTSIIVVSQPKQNGGSGGGSCEPVYQIIDNERYGPEQMQQLPLPAEFDSGTKVTSSLLQARNTLSRQSLRRRPSNISPDFFNNQSTSNNKRSQPDLSPGYYPNKPIVGQKNIGGGMYYFVMKHKRKVRLGGAAGNTGLGLSGAGSNTQSKDSLMFNNEDTFRWKQPSKMQNNSKMSPTNEMDGGGPKTLLQRGATNTPVREQFGYATQLTPNAEGLEYSIHQLESMAILLKQLEKTVGNAKPLNQGHTNNNGGKGTLVYGANRENKTWIPVKNDVVHTRHINTHSAGSNTRDNSFDSKIHRLSHAVSKEKIETQGTRNSNLKNSVYNQHNILANKAKKRLFPQARSHDSQEISMDIPESKSPLNNNDAQRKISFGLTPKEKQVNPYITDQQIEEEGRTIEKLVQQIEEPLTNYKTQGTSVQQKEIRIRNYRPQSKSTSPAKNSKEQVCKSLNSKINKPNRIPLDRTQTKLMTKEQGTSLRGDKALQETPKMLQTALNFGKTTVNNNKSPLIKEIDSSKIVRTPQKTNRTPKSSFQVGGSMKTSLLEQNRNKNGQSNRDTDNNIEAQPIQLMGINSIRLEKITPELAYLDCTIEKEDCQESNNDEGQKQQKDLEIQTGQFDPSQPYSHEYALTAPTTLNQPNHNKEFNEEQLFQMSKKNYELYKKGVLNQDQKGRRFTTQAGNKKASLINSQSPDVMRTSANQNFSKILQKMLQRQKGGEDSNKRQRPHNESLSPLTGMQFSTSIGQDLSQSQSITLKASTLNMDHNQSIVKNKHQKTQQQNLSEAKAKFGQALGSLQNGNKNASQIQFQTKQSTLVFKGKASQISLPENTKDRLSTPPKVQKTLSQSLSKAGEISLDNDDIRQDDVYNFIKKAAAQKNETCSNMMKGASEFSKAIADVYACNKNNNILTESQDQQQPDNKVTPSKLNDSLEKVDKPLYYNFGLQKPVIGPFLNSSPPLPPVLQTPMPPLSNKYTNAGNSSQARSLIGITHGQQTTVESLMMGTSGIIQGERMATSFKPPLKNKATKLPGQISTSSSLSKNPRELLQSGKSGEGYQNDNQKPDDAASQENNSLKKAQTQTSQAQLHESASKVLVTEKSQDNLSRQQSETVLQTMKSAPSQQVLTEVVDEEIETSPKQEKESEPQAQIKPLPEKQYQRNTKMGQTQQIRSISQTPARLLPVQKESKLAAVTPYKSTIKQSSFETTLKRVQASTVDVSAVEPLPPLDQRIRPALFVMLEKQLAEAKKSKLLKDQIRELSPVVEMQKIMVLKIFHKEDLNIKRQCEETRIQKALNLSNTLLKLANKSQLPPQALYNVPISTFFNAQDMKAMKRAGICVPKNKELSQFVRSREYYGTAREQAFIILTAELQISNNIPGTKLTQELGGGGITGGYSKFYVGYGNNYLLVKQILKNRWWQSPTENKSFDECNVVWTSWRKQKITNKLDTYEDYLENYGAFGGDRVPAQNKVHIKKVYARMEDNFHLANKKGLLLNLKEYYRLQGKCVFEQKVFPQTFLIRSSAKQGPDEHDMLRRYIFANPGTIWIVKPGENSNRGAGILLCETAEELECLIRSIQSGSSKQIIEHNCEPDSSRSQKRHQLQANMRTMIVQAYIKNPLLIHKRKFDIRCYGMLVTQYGNMRGYFYEDGYLRTSSKEFSLENFSNKYIHLTNDAIQKNSEDYGKFENGNKLSYSDFQRYLESAEFLATSKYQIPGGIKFARDLLPQIRHLVTESFRSVAFKRIDPYRRVNSFEVFGFDFMIDEDFCVQLIEANTNPCLEINGCPVLARIIPSMIECALRIAVDPLLPPPDWNFKKGLEPISENKFQLVYDDLIELESLRQLYERDKSSQLRLNNNLTALREEEKQLEQSLNDEDEEEERCRESSLCKVASEGTETVMAAEQVSPSKKNKPPHHRKKGHKKHGKKVCKQKGPNEGDQEFFCEGN